MKAMITSPFTPMEVELNDSSRNLLSITYDYRFISRNHKIETPLCECDNLFVPF